MITARSRVWEDYIKDLTLAQMAGVYTLDVIASEKGVTLSEGMNRKKVAEAARTYLDGLEDTGAGLYRTQ